MQRHSNEPERVFPSVLLKITKCQQCSENAHYFGLGKHQSFLCQPNQFLVSNATTKTTVLACRSVGDFCLLHAITLWHLILSLLPETKQCMLCLGMDACVCVCVSVCVCVCERERVCV